MFTSTQAGKRIQIIHFSAIPGAPTIAEMIEQARIMRLSSTACRILWNGRNRARERKRPIRLVVGTARAAAVSGNFGNPAMPRAA